MSDVVITAGKFIRASGPGQVQPFNAGMEAMKAALDAATTNVCSDITNGILDNFSEIPGIGFIFWWFRNGCNIW